MRGWWCRHAAVKADGRPSEDDCSVQRSSAFPAVPALLLTLAVSTAEGCTPTVKVATDEPITINLNVNIKHEILVKVDKQLDTLFSEDSDLF